MSHDFPTLQEVIAIHEILIETFGGPTGLRDPGALEAALVRPQLGYFATSCGYSRPTGSSLTS